MTPQVKGALVGLGLLGGGYVVVRRFTRPVSDARPAVVPIGSSVPAGDGGGGDMGSTFFDGFTPAINEPGPADTVDPGQLRRLIVDALGELPSDPAQSDVGGGYGIPVYVVHPQRVDEVRAGAYPTILEPKRPPQQVVTQNPWRAFSTRPPERFSGSFGGGSSTGTTKTGGSGPRPLITTTTRRK